MRHFARQVGCALTLGGLVAACTPTPPPKPDSGGFMVGLDRSVMDEESPRGAAWLRYGLERVRANQKLREVRRNPAADDYLIELRARAGMAEFWRDAQRKDAATDAYLDQLVALDDQGRLEEHVLVSLAKPGWTIPADELARIDFAAIAELAREPIDAPTLATAKPSSGGLWSAAPGAALPDPEALPPPPAGCLEAMPTLRRAMTTWQQEAERLDGAPAAADDRAGFLQVLANLPPDAPHRTRGATWVGARPYWLSFLAGFCAVELDRTAEAERWLEQAVALSPRNPTARMELTHVLVAEGKFDRADGILDDALAHSQDRCELARAWRRRGYIRFEQRRLAESEAAYLRSLEFDPASAIARSELDLLQREISKSGGTPQWYVPPGSNTSVTVCPPS